MERLEKIETPLKEMLKKSEEFHGHLGPFLVIGIRAGVIGLRELGVRKGDRDLFVKIMLENVVPISCTIDGLQITTSCTMGNQRLSIEDSDLLAIEFKNKSGVLELIINQKFFEGLKDKLSGKKLRHEEIMELGYKIATMNEKDLFTIKRKEI